VLGVYTEVRKWMHFEWGNTALDNLPPFIYYELLLTSTVLLNCILVHYEVCMHCMYGTVCICKNIIDNM